jgi:hypothetical protein
MKAAANKFQSGESYFYRAFGLNIRSSIEIPELIAAAGVPDVSIRYGSVPDQLEEPKKISVRFQAKQDLFLLKVDNVAKYLVYKGNEITVQKYPGATEEEIHLFLLGSAIGALIHQRGMFPVHASSVKVDGGCVMFCGASGDGKSTTAKAFLERGYPLHTDDICVISINGEGIPMVSPESPHLKLWEDSLLEIGKNPEAYSRVRHVINKFTVLVEDSFDLTALPVKKIYILSPGNSSDIKITGIKGVEKFKSLKTHVYRRKFVEGLGTEVNSFKTAAFVGSHVPVSRVHRPLKPFLLKELVELLEKDFKNE